MPTSHIDPKAFAAMYPILVRSYGGVKLNGKSYLWDYAREELIAEDDLEAMKAADRKAREAESEKAKWAQVKMGLDDAQG